MQPNRVEYGPGTMAIAFTPSTVQPVYSGGISKSSGCQTRQRVPQRAVLENEKSAKPGRSARLAVAATSVAASHSRGRRSERKKQLEALERDFHSTFAFDVGPAHAFGHGFDRSRLPHFIDCVW